MRFGRTTQGGFAAAVVGITAVTIWLSVAIPTREHAYARSQVADVRSAVLGAAAASSEGGTAGRCGVGPEQLHAPYVDDLKVNSRSCEASGVFTDGPNVARALRGARIVISLDRGNGTDGCRVSGGSGTSQADMPGSCRYELPQSLL